MNSGEVSPAELAVYDALETRLLARALDALRASGVDPLLFKGAALARTAYPRSWARARADADVLIPLAAWAIADRVLLSAVGPRLQPVIDPRVMGQWQYRDTETGIILDVHCRLFEPAPFANLVTFEALAEASVSVPGLEPVRAPGRVHALWIAILHPVAHHDAEIDAIWDRDVALLASQMEHDDWGRFAALARKTGTCAICRSGLRRAATGAAPAAVMAQLDVPGERSARLLRGGFDSALARQVAFLRALPTWRDRVRELRARLLPPAEYMTACYGTATSTPLPWLYCRRIVAGMAGPWRWRAQGARARFARQGSGIRNQESGIRNQPVSDRRSQPLQ